MLKFLKQLPNLAKNPEKTREKVAEITKILKTAQKYILVHIVFTVPGTFMCELFTRFIFSFASSGTSISPNR